MLHPFNQILKDLIQFIWRNTRAPRETIFLNGKKFFSELQHFFSSIKSMNIHYNKIAFTILRQVDRLS